MSAPVGVLLQRRRRLARAPLSGIAAKGIEKKLKKLGFKIAMPLWSPTWEAR
ncbi:MAG TPA: hypothetical protein VK487_11675 [Candidatus Bathyarchaeia archaeon]|nr:hypothetical protein [Candidatus Bathyarchaeia archaeon]